MVTVWLLASNSPSDLKKAHPSALLRGIGGATSLNSERLISEERSNQPKLLNTIILYDTGECIDFGQGV